MKKLLLNFSWLVISPLFYILVENEFTIFHLLFVLYLSGLFGVYIFNPLKIKQYLYKIAILVILIVPAIFLAMVSELRSYAFKGNISLSGISDILSKWFKLEKDEIFYGFFSIFLYVISLFPLMFFMEDINMIFGWTMQGLLYGVLLSLLQIATKGQQK